MNCPPPSREWSPWAAQNGNARPAARGESRVPEIQRLLPHAAEAERALLSSFFQASRQIGLLCAEKAINVSHFHVPAHAIIFEQLFWMHEQRMEFDEIMITNMLNDQGLLEAVGGPAYMMEITLAVPTPAMAGYYIEILQEKRTARELIKVCQECTTRAYEEQDDLPALLRDMEGRVTGIVREQASAGLREKLAGLVFDMSKPPPPTRPIIRLGDVTIGTPGNLVAIQAQAKAGKSAALQGLMAATMDPTGDCLGFTSENPQGHALLHLDTEQSDADHDTACRHIVRRAGRDAPPPWFVSYRVTRLTIPERLVALRIELPRLKAKHGGILAVVLDGAADLGLDPNDTKEAFGIVDELHRLAGEFDTVIVCVLHENPGENTTGKTRGHLGSQLERKAETNLRLEKDAENVSLMYSVRSRHAHIPKERGLRFTWSDEARMHVSTEAAFNARGAANRFQSLYTKEQVVAELSAVEGIEPRELYRRMEEKHSMSKATAKRFLAKLKAAKKVEERDGHLYLASSKK